MTKLKSGRHTSAIKETRKNFRRRKANKKIRIKISTLVKQLNSYIASKNLTEAKKLLTEVFSTLDKAAKKNIIHKNAAARKKSRLVKKIKALTS